MVLGELRRFKGRWFLVRPFAMGEQLTIAYVFELCESRCIYCLQFEDLWSICKGCVEETVRWIDGE